MPSGAPILGRRAVKPRSTETRVAHIACGTPILRWALGRRGGGPATAERRQGLLPPKPASGVHFGGVFFGFLLPWLAGGPAGASGPSLCCVFTVQWRRIGVPHANCATWVSDVTPRLLPPKPCSGVCFGGAWPRFSPPWLAGGASGRRRRLLPPKPCSGVYFGGAWPRFSPPWLAGGPPGASGLSF